MGRVAVRFEEQSRGGSQAAVGEPLHPSDAQASRRRIPPHPCLCQQLPGYDRTEAVDARLQLAALEHVLVKPTSSAGRNVGQAGDAIPCLRVPSRPARPVHFPQRISPGRAPSPGLPRRPSKQPGRFAGFPDRVRSPPGGRWFPLSRGQSERQAVAPSAMWPSNRLTRTG